MSTITIIDNEFTELVYHADKGIVHHTYRKPISGEPFRTLLNTGVELLQKHGATKWLSDNRKHVGLPEEDVKWSQEDWFPRAQKAGWKYWALVAPPDPNGAMVLKRSVDVYWEKGLRIMVFSDLESAMLWLERQGE